MKRGMGLVYYKNKYWAKSEERKISMEEFGMIECEKGENIQGSENMDLQEKVLRRPCS